ECSGFSAMVTHPVLEREKIEAIQREFYKKDFQILGPSIIRVAMVKYNGWKKYRNHANPVLRKKAQEFRLKFSLFLALLPAAIVGPKITLRNRLRYLKQLLIFFVAAPWSRKPLIFASPIM